MKKITLSLLVCFIALNIKSQTPPKLYIQFVSHNEDNIGYKDNINQYLAARNNLKSVAQGFQTRNVKWNLGSDYSMLFAALKYDTNSVIVNTAGKNILKYLKEDYGVECDPHSHESKYNYGTIAYLHSQLGFTPSNNMSGFLWNTTQNGNWWYDYQNGSVSDSVPSYTWNPDVMWGAATPQHTLDLENWGLWKPKDVASFTTVHTPSNTLINCSQGCKIKVEDTSQVMVIVNQVVSAINKIQGGQAPASGIYNTSIFFSEGKINTLPFRTKLNTIADSLAKYVTQGKLEWKTITEVGNYWKTTYAAQPFIRNCDFSAVGLNENAIENSLSIFPNPANYFFNVKLKGYNLERISIIDILGKEVYNKQFSDNENEQMISTEKFNPGVYFLKINSSGETIIKKVLIEK